MQERNLGRLKPEMDVCDVTGEKVGRIAHIYRPAGTMASMGGGTPAAPGAESIEDQVMEVKTGFLGLGSHLYIPLGAIQETLIDCIFLAEPKEAFERLGWQDKPAQLERLQ
jgi:hypothetical protein